ncbi:hypothetical protein JEQ21_04365 [Streptococcus sp. 121]|uniref:hypothetical protein n=1 Tax=Streptococcus sp. 121 TaxID=2797637 RepID=UPI0018F102D1|nr:hypothetical protein [Streptococcus sp. 121]MBJ6745706.1 hypothetical protein [Streptococcus sp. 121]
MTYKNIILDDSILDIDSWFPKEAIDEMIEILKTQAKSPIEIQSFKNSQYIIESFDPKIQQESKLKKPQEYLSELSTVTNYQSSERQVA